MAVPETGVVSACPLSLGEARYCHAPMVFVTGRVIAIPISSAGLSGSVIPSPSINAPIDCHDGLVVLLLIDGSDEEAFPGRIGALLGVTVCVMVYSFALIQFRGKSLSCEKRPGAIPLYWSHARTRSAAGPANCPDGLNRMADCAVSKMT